MSQAVLDLFYTGAGMGLGMGVTFSLITILVSIILEFGASPLSRKKKTKE